MSWQPMDTVPRDGTLVVLKVRPLPGVDYLINPVSEDAEVVTVGFNHKDHSGIDEWDVMGWDWSHDCITNCFGGEVIAWQPLPGGI